ncbi:small multidrug efflux protein [Cellulomonas fengjieae]|uniref:Small multidrug efflux protein n=1 Tax=Cellulomonas fengjieae TaxID=2819978 RepID=A0ABS3SBD4_9CELL|nr:small multidrug efflux protein [Cellulomonas fengjieae]MBO3083063.1 small multidrug efflux protein [Cellulomonas fengjieae]QVI65567.1 small multidrug efflux protein [Cellulomonas fengjieae]
MSPIQELVLNIQELVARVPELVQPLIVALAGAIPFVEGELAAMIGLVGGLHPVVAGIAAAAGNFLSVAVVVAVTSRARTAVVDRRAHVGATVGGGLGSLETVNVATSEDTKPLSKGRQRVHAWLVRFGVPGASILGPLAIPTHFTAAVLVGAGSPRRWVLLWQAVAIALWTTVTTVSIWIALTYVVGV